MKTAALPQDSWVFRKAVAIRVPRHTLWVALTDIEQMRGWMGLEGIDIVTDWTIGSTVQISGDLHGVSFVNTGRVLEVEPDTMLRYSHLSSISRLPDVAESYAEIAFRLVVLSERVTELTVEVNHAPTEVIYRHLAYYWNVTVEVIKRRLEGSL